MAARPAGCGNAGRPPDAGGEPASSSQSQLQFGAKLGHGLMLGHGISAPGDRRQVNKATDGEFFPFTLTDANIAEAELRLSQDTGTCLSAGAPRHRSTILLADPAFAAAINAIAFVKNFQIWKKLANQHLCHRIIFLRVERISGAPRLSGRARDRRRARRYGRRQE